MATEYAEASAALPCARLPHGAMERQTEWPAKGGEMIIRCSSCSQLEDELRAAVDALRDLLEDGGLACIDHAERIIAAYDAKHPEGK